MTISKTLQDYLRQHDVRYRLVSHAKTGSSMETAEQAHIPGGALAKGVVTKDGDGFLMLVLPSDYHVDLDTLGSRLGKFLTMASENELSELFDDCQRGAVPPLGYVYGIKTLWDPNTELGKDEKVYFEAGDHEHLVQVSGVQFHELMASAERSTFGRHI